MKNFQFYRDLGLIKVIPFEGGYECNICQVEIHAPSLHFKRYHPEYWLPPSQIRDIRQIRDIKVKT